MHNFLSTKLYKKAYCSLCFILLIFTLIGCGSNASEFLQCVLSDIALNASRANIFSKNFTDIKGVIDNHCERIEFFTKVLSDYNSYKCQQNTKGKISDFVKCTWKDYINEFSVDGIDPEIQEGLVKIILYSIVRRRISINNIKKGVNL